MTGRQRAHAEVLAVAMAEAMGASDEELRALARALRSETPTPEPWHGVVDFARNVALGQTPMGEATLVAVFEKVGGLIQPVAETPAT